MLICDQLVLAVPKRPQPIQPISLEIKKPGLYLILGPNGIGKSTFSETLLGIRSPQQGSFHWSNLPRFGYVPQNPTLNPFLPLPLSSLLKESLPFEKKKDIKKKNKDCMEKKLETIQKEWSLEPCWDQPFFHLSQGQKARALIARALLHDPNVLIFDESLSNLDFEGQKKLVKTLAHLCEDGKTLVFVIDHHTHHWKALTTGSIEFHLEASHCQVKFYVH